MKKFFVKGFLFLLVCLTISIITNNILIGGLKRLESGRFGVWNAIMNGSINSDIIFCGSSRCFEHFNPMIVSAKTGLTSFNIGLDGSFFELQYARLYSYLKHNSCPKIVIQELDIEALQVRKYVWNPEQYLPYLNDSMIYTSTCAIDKNFLYKKNIPLFGFIGAKPDLILNSLNGYLNFLVDNSIIRGFCPVDKTWQTDFDNFIKTNPKGVSYPIEDKAIEFLLSIIQLVKACNSQLVFVYSPEYFENHKYTNNREEIFKIYNDIATKYKIPFWDFSYDSISYNKSLFFNSQHLNIKGAKLLSEHIADSINIFFNQNKQNKMNNYNL